MKRNFNKNNGILIIGGGLLLSYAIKKAKEKKIKVYLVDGSEMCYSKALADTADYIYNDDRVYNFLVPIRDGLMVCIKNE